jgi:hypothetical protein
LAGRIQLIAHNLPHKKTAATAAAIAPNLASKNACDVGTAAPVDLAVVALESITDLTMLNWSETCCSLNALAPLGSAVYQPGLEKNVVVVPSLVTSAGIE